MNYMVTLNAQYKGKNLEMKLINGNYEVDWATTQAREAKDLRNCSAEEFFDILAKAYPGTRRVHLHTYKFY